MQSEHNKSTERVLHELLINLDTMKMQKMGFPVRSLKAWMSKDPLKRDLGLFATLTVSLFT